jgi:hypothetical protein
MQNTEHEMSVCVENDTFEAALYVYDGRWLFQIDCDQNGTVFHFAMEPWIYDELHAAYLSDEGQGVSDIRTYSVAFKKVERLKGLAKRSSDGHFVDRNWQNGKRNTEEN